jgi:transcriptional regulator with XRE-family HTH domain
MKQKKTIEQQFGEALRQLRIQKKLSQEALGFESGYHRTYISLLERGKKSPSLNTIFKLADTLNIKPSELVGSIQAETEKFKK